MSLNKAPMARQWTQPASHTSQVPLALAGFATVAAVLAAYLPLQLSIAAVFLFAGPHNWMEARYLVARMPVRWGRRRAFFQVAIAGLVLLCPTFSLIAVNRSVWHTAAACWVLMLVRMERKDAYAGALPVAFFWMAGAWAAPGLADLTLVFLHPLIALWFVDRQIARTRAEWLPRYRTVAAAIVPLALFVVRPPLPLAPLIRTGETFSLTFAHTPVGPALIALHAFLELLHYGAWVFLLPSIGLVSAPWDLRSIPLVRHRDGWPRLVVASFSAGVGAVILLWIGFLIDYRTTYEVYFTLAVVHVLAEVPFLVRLR